jgi:hypothetical protein
MRPPRLDVQKVKYGELFRCLAEQEQAMTSAEQLFLVMGKCSTTLLGMFIFLCGPRIVFCGRARTPEAFVYVKLKAQQKGAKSTAT